MSSCLPCCQPPQRFAAQFLGANDAEAQGIDDLCKTLLETLGCRDRQERGQMTVFAVVHKNVLEAFKRSFPQADSDCLAQNIQGIIEAVAAGLSKCKANDPIPCIQETIAKGSAAIAGLLSCLFGTERSQAIELQFYRSLPQAIPVGAITCLLQKLPMLCRMFGGGGQSQPSPCTASPQGPPPPFPPWKATDENR